MITIVISKKAFFAIIGVLLLLVWLSVSILQNQKLSYAILAEHAESLDEALDSLHASTMTGSFEEVLDKLDRAEDILIRRKGIMNSYRQNGARNKLQSIRAEASSRLKSSMSSPYSGSVWYEAMTRLDKLEAYLTYDEIASLSRDVDSVHDSLNELSAMESRSYEILKLVMDNLGIRYRARDFP